MFKKKNQREDLSTFARTIDKLINSKDAAEKRVYEYEGKMHQYHQQLWEIQQENIKLTRENEYLRTILDTEADTQIIKYQGKIYKFTTTVHFHNAGEEDTLDIDAVCCGEVNKDGKSEM